MDADVKRDLVRKTFLKLISEGCTPYTDIEKDASTKCRTFASRNVVIRQFYKYFVAQGYIERFKRDKYRLTEKGGKLLSIMSSF